MFRGTLNRKVFRFNNPRNKCTASYVHSASRKFVFAGCSRRTSTQQQNYGFLSRSLPFKQNSPVGPCPLRGRSLRSGAWSWCSRALVPPTALLRSPTAVLAAAVGSPPGRLRRPAPQGGSLVRAYRPRGSGER